MGWGTLVRVVCEAEIHIRKRDLCGGSVWVRAASGV